MLDLRRACLRLLSAAAAAAAASQRESAGGPETPWSAPLLIYRRSNLQFIVMIIARLPLSSSACVGRAHLAPGHSNEQPRARARVHELLGAPAAAATRAAAAAAKSKYGQTQSMSPWRRPTRGCRRRRRRRRSCSQLTSFGQRSQPAPMGVKFE